MDVWARLLMNLGTSPCVAVQADDPCSCNAMDLTMPGAPKDAPQMRTWDLRLGLPLL
ncbi:hypothetical protein FHT15_002305 [Xanthomonas campestris]